MNTVKMALIKENIWSFMKLEMKNGILYITESDCIGEYEIKPNESITSAKLKKWFKQARMEYQEEQRKIKEEKYDKSKTADTGSKQQEPGKPDMSPFYGVVKEAYKENGKNLAVMMDIGRLNKDTAEELFVKSVSYIQTQDKLKQDELYEAFASGLQDAIADPNISFETKQILTGFAINYEFDNYKDKIQENIEKGCRWDDIVKHQEKILCFHSSFYS